MCQCVAWGLVCVRSTYRPRACIPSPLRPSPFCTDPRACYLRVAPRRSGLGTAVLGPVLGGTYLSLTDDVCWSRAKIASFVPPLTTNLAHVALDLTAPRTRERRQCRPARFTLTLPQPLTRCARWSRSACSCGRAPGAADPAAAGAARGQRRQVGAPGVHAFLHRAPEHALTGFLLLGWAPAHHALVAVAVATYRQARVHVRHRHQTAHPRARVASIVDAASGPHVEACSPLHGRMHAGSQTHRRQARRLPGSPKQQHHRLRPAATRRPWGTRRGWAWGRGSGACNQSTPPGVPQCPSANLRPLRQELL